MLYLDKSKTAKAETIFEEIAHLPEGKNGFKLQSEALYQLGNLKAKEKINNLALNYLNRGYGLSITNRNINQELKISKKLSEVYESMKQSNNSLAYLKIYTTLKDSIDFDNKLNNKNVISEKFKVDEIMIAMEKMEQGKKQQEKAARFSKLINILSIALITILSLLSLSLYKNNIIRNKSNELLRDKNSELEIANKPYAVLPNICLHHHRIQL